MYYFDFHDKIEVLEMNISENAKAEDKQISNLPFPSFSLSHTHLLSHTISLSLSLSFRQYNLINPKLQECHALDKLYCPATEVKHRLSSSSNGTRQRLTTTKDASFQAYGMEPIILSNPD